MTRLSAYTNPKRQRGSGVIPSLALRIDIMIRLGL